MAQTPKKKKVSSKTVLELIGMDRVNSITNDTQWMRTRYKGFWDYCSTNPEQVLAAISNGDNIVSIPESKTVVGYEFEMENININKLVLDPLWTQHADGSLRNNGIEFISCPLTDKLAPQAVAGLWYSLTKFSKVQPDFSWRTSVHVHCNVQDLRLHQIRKLMMLYLIFEPAMFAFAGGGRDTSNFCVPIYQSSLQPVLRQFFDADPDALGESYIISQLFSRWNKYTAFNLSRIRDLGTVEYRHFPGEFDFARLMAWSSIIFSMYNAAVDMKTEEIKNEVLSLNTTSRYQAFQERVFGIDLCRFAFGNQHIPFEELMATGISFAKECLAPVEVFEMTPGSMAERFLKKKEDIKKARKTVKKSATILEEAPPQEG